MTPNMHGVGGRAEIGIVSEWAANWICNGNSAALTAMMVLADIDAGIPWIYRGNSTNWGPVNFFRDRAFGYAPVDRPKVLVPSLSVDWIPELHHHPCLSYVPYLITGDPFYLETLQMLASWLVAENAYHRQSGLQVNYDDLASPTMPGFDQAFSGARLQSRGYAWTIRTYAAASLATPASVPSWLLPKSYFQEMLIINAQKADSWGSSYPHEHPELRQYPELQLQGTAETGIIDQGFFDCFLCYSIGFAVLQAGITAWSRYLNWMAQRPIAMASGTGSSGWDARFPAIYQFFTQRHSTDYLPVPPPWNAYSDIYDWHAKSGLLGGYRYSFWGWNAGENFNLSFYPWKASEVYKCNSWIFEVRTGCPLLPNPGDIVSITISGPFPGSPVKLSYIVNSGDIAVITTAANNYLIDGTLNSPHPITDSLIAQINANSTLSRAGLTASYIPTVPASAGGCFFRSPGGGGRIFLNFNSARAETSYVNVSGTFKTNSGGSIYIQPNGDGVVNGTASFFPNRPLAYQCGKTGTSAPSGGPTGDTLQTPIIDGSTMWYFVPDVKSYPLVTNGGSSAPFPAFGYGGPFAKNGFNYMPYLWAALHVLETARVSGATAAAGNLNKMMDWYFKTPGSHNLFNLSIQTQDRIAHRP